MTRTQREAVAYLVADYWRNAALDASGHMPSNLMAHPLACVQAALNGETDPDQLGVGSDSATAEMIREMCR